MKVFDLFVSTSCKMMAENNQVDTVDFQKPLDEVSSLLFCSASLGYLCCN